MPTVGTRSLLTLSAFAPLWLVLAILEVPGAGLAALPFYVLSLASPLALFIYLRAIHRIDKDKNIIAVANRRDQDLLAYVATYLVPFAFVTVEAWREKIALGLFLLMVVALGVHARTYYVNPVLAALGYRLWEVEFSGGITVTLLTAREHLSPGDAVLTRTLDHAVYVETRK